MRRHLLAVAMALALVAGACGGGDDDEAGGAAGAVTVGPSGGTVSSADGRLSLSIPPEALFEDIEISISSASRDEWPDDIAAAEPLVVYRLEPDGLDFSEPVPMALQIDLAVSDEGAAAPYLLVSGNELEALDVRVVVDLETGAAIVSASISHFSWIAAVDGDLMVGLEKIEPPVRPVGAEWSALVNVRNNSNTAVDVGRIEYLAEDSVIVVGSDTASGFELEAQSRAAVPDGGDPTSTEWGTWACHEPGTGFYGVAVSALGYPFGDQFRPAGGTAEVFVLVDCVAAAASTSSTNVTGSEEPTTDNTTHTETTSLVDVLTVCEDFVFDVSTATPCVQEGVARAGTAAIVLGTDFTWSFGTVNDRQVDVDVNNVCPSPCIDPTTLSHVEPGSWTFQQFLVEFHVGNDRAILCDDDPAFPCQLTNMQTFELLSPEAEGVPVPDRVIAEEYVGLELSGPWGFDLATGGPEIGGASISQIVIQWWFGEEPTNSRLALLTIAGDDLIEFSEQLAESGEVIVGGAFGQ